MSARSVPLKFGESQVFSGHDVGSLTLINGLAAFSDQDPDGERQIHTMKNPDTRTDVSANGDILIVGLADSSRVIVHEERRPRAKKED